MSHELELTEEQMAYCQQLQNKLQSMLHDFINEEADTLENMDLTPCVLHQQIGYALAAVAHMRIDLPDVTRNNKKAMRDYMQHLAEHIIDGWTGLMHVVEDPELEKEMAEAASHYAPPKTMLQ